jgi:uncharacterized protein YjiS (DUF1127 family)
MHLLHCWTAAFSLYQRTSKAYSETDGEPESFGIAKLESMMIFTRLIGALRAERRYHARLKELYRLSDRELAASGLSRSDIPRIAWESARA